MQFLVDHCISHRVCKAIAVLTASGPIQIHALKDHFPVTATDKEFLQKLAADGNWCIISQDTRVPAQAVRLRLAAEQGSIIFMLNGKWGNETLWRKASHLIAWWPFMQALAVPEHLKKIFDISGPPGPDIPPLFKL